MVKEKWQIWKKEDESGFLYTWVAEQQNSESLFFENSSWLFNPRYDKNVRNIDIRIFPSWYDRNKTVKIENVFINNLNINMGGDTKQIFDCNKTKKRVTEDPAIDQQKYVEENVLFSNSLFTLGKLYKEGDNVEFDYKNGRAFYNKKLKVEIIPYYEEDTELNNDKIIFNPYNVNNQYLNILSELVKKKYLNPNLIIKIKDLIDRNIKESEKSKVFNNITNNLLINRGNLESLKIYFDEIEIFKLQCMFYSLDEIDDIPVLLKNRVVNIDPGFNLNTEINSFIPTFPKNADIKRQAVIVINEHTLDKDINLERNEENDDILVENEINISRIFNDYISKNKYYFENYTSYGDQEIYQNEIIINYNIPLVNEVNRMCPIFRNYISTTKKKQSEELSHKINIIMVINYCKIIESVVESLSFDKISNVFNLSNNNSYLYDLGVIISEADNDSQEFDYNNLDLEGKTLNELVKKIRLIEDIDLKHEQKDVKFNYISDEVIPSPSPSPSLSMDTPPSYKEVIGNPEENRKKLKYLRDIYIITQISKKIKTIILQDINNVMEIGKSDLIIELLGKMEIFYIKAINKYKKYFEKENPLFAKMNPSDLNIGLEILPQEFKKPPEKYSETINNAVQNYKDMVFNVFN